MPPRGELSGLQETPGGEGQVLRARFEGSGDPLDAEARVGFDVGEQPGLGGGELRRAALLRGSPGRPARAAALALPGGGLGAESLGDRFQRRLADERRHVGHELVDTSSDLAVDVTHGGDVHNGAPSKIQCARVSGVALPVDDRAVRREAYGRRRAIAAERFGSERARAAVARVLSREDTPPPGAPGGKVERPLLVGEVGREGEVTDRHHERARAVVGGSNDEVFATPAELGRSSTQRDEITMKLDRARVRRRAGLVPVELAGFERLLGLGVEEDGAVAERLDLARASLAYGVDERGVGVAREVVKGRRCPVLLALKQHRHVGGQENEGCRQALLRPGQQRRVARAAARVGDLIVILRVHDQLPAGAIRRGGAVGPTAKPRRLPRQHEPLPKRGGEVGGPAEVDEITAPVARQKGVEAVVEVVAPLRVHAPAASIRRVDDSDVVQIALGDEPSLPIEPPGLGVKTVGQLGEHVAHARVVDAVHRVEPKAIDVKLGQPVQGVVDEVTPDPRSVLAVERNRLSPWRLVPAAEVRPKIAEGVPLGPQVVVDDVEHDREATAVTRVDEPLEPLGTAVRRLGRVEVHSVVTPVAATGELGDGHDLDGVDPHVPEMVEALDDRLERARSGERAHVKLVENQALEGQAAPRRVGPIEPGRDDPGRPVNAVRLKARRGVGPAQVSIEHVSVVRPGRSARLDDEVAAIVRPHLAPLALDLERDAPRAGSPHSERGGVVAEHPRAKPELERRGHSGLRPARVVIVARSSARRRVSSRGPSLQRQFPVAEPGTFMRARVPRPRRSCIGTIARSAGD